MKGQISLAQSALQRMTASDQLPSLDKETLNNLGLSILGDKPDGYITAMQTLAQCGMNAIEARYP